MASKLAPAPWPNCSVSQTLIRHCSHRHPLPLGIRGRFAKHRLGQLYSRQFDWAAARQAYYASSSFTRHFTRFSY